MCFENHIVRKHGFRQTFSNVLRTQIIIPFRETNNNPYIMCDDENLKLREES